MADLKISDLAGSARAESGDFFIINKGDSNTQKLDFSDLLASLGAGGEDPDDGNTITGFGFAPVALNFPNAADSAREVGGQAQSSDQRPDFKDLFNQEAAAITYKMPRGATAAVVIMLYSCAIDPTPLSTIYRQGYANFGYTLNVTSDNGAIEIAPGSKIARGSKLRAEMIAWQDVVNTPELRRAGMQSGNSVVQRIKFNEGSTLTLKPYGEIHRAKACTAKLGSGKVLLLPYNHSDISISRTVDIALAMIDPADEMDDGVSDPVGEQIAAAHDIKTRMNYMTNAIRETMIFDTLTPEEEAACNDGLAGIFSLRNNATTSYDFYEDALDQIASDLKDIVGFKFGFQTDARIGKSF